MSEEEKNEETPKAPSSEDIQLYKHEGFTDGSSIHLDVMTPVNISANGKISVIKDEPKKIIGKSHIEVGEQLMPYSFVMEKAKNIKEAIDMFDEEFHAAVEKTKERVEAMQKENENKLVVPGNQDGKIIT